MQDATTDKRDRIPLRVRTELLNPQRADDVPQAVAYAFSMGGRLLDRSKLDDNSVTVLNLPPTKRPQRVRVIVGPDLEDDKEQPISAAELLRRGGEERLLRIDPNRRLETFVPVLPEKWLCWLRGLCFVRGTLLKQVDTGGISVDMPVCNATVEIYEVDPLLLILPRLPDLVIERLRDIILNPLPLPQPPRPLPDPFPFPPEPFPGPDPLPFAGAERLQPINAEMDVMAAMHTPAAGELRTIAATANTFQLRNALLDYPVLVRPLLCAYLPFTVTRQLVATTTTDDCGRFFAAFSMGCSSDTPDLYFVAKQQVLPPPFGPFTIYEPTPIHCYTFWDHDCSEEVTLYTTSPFARTCPPCPPVVAPNNWVLMMAVGNYPVNLIQHDDSQADFGRATQARSGGQLGSPFGGFLRFRVEFDNSLRDDLNVEYYRMAWRKAGTTDTFMPLDTEVHRHYTHEIGTELVLESYSLGPQVVGTQSSLFEIPPALPPLGQWSVPDVLEDLTSAKFNTSALVPPTDAGLYEIKLELFDGSGNAVDINALGIKYRMPDTDDLNGTIPTQDAATLGLVAGNAFVMTLHIDNNPCSASLPAPTLNGVPANDCGVLDYNPASPGTVQMPFTASHPNDFATYTFSLRRGVQLLTPVASPPNPPSPTTPQTIAGEPVSNAGSTSPVTAPVSSLLGACPVAGYSESVRAYAMAFNGWSRLSGLDAHANRAFVLAPEEMME